MHFCSYIIFLIGLEFHKDHSALQSILDQTGVSVESLQDMTTEQSLASKPPVARPGQKASKTVSLLIVLCI